MGHFVQWDWVLLILDASLACQEELGKWNLESHQLQTRVIYLHQSSEV